MKSLHLSVLLSFSMLCSFSQSSYRGQQTVQVSLGQSWHGTGDLSGLIFDVAHNYSFNKRWSYTTSLAGTIHWGADYYTGSNLLNFRPADRSLVFTTAGVQLAPLIQYHVVNSSRHMIKAGGGALVRFQSSSYPMGWSYVNSPADYPEPFYVLYNRGNKPNILTAGYTFGLQYLYKMPRLELGLKAMFQNDTEGDALRHLSLLVGRRFSRLQ